MGSLIDKFNYNCENEIKDFNHSLIIYFSRAGNNYVNGQIVNLKTGNTEVIAKKIAEIINSKLYKIEPIVEYSKDYSECLEETINDKRRNARPELKHYLKDIKQYDVIFLGYPNYWESLPMPIITFLERYDFKNKIIKPFCTHEGGEFGNSIDQIKKICKGANVKQGLAILGIECLNIKKVLSKLEKWIKMDL